MKSWFPKHLKKHYRLYKNASIAALQSADKTGKSSKGGATKLSMGDCPKVKYLVSHTRHEASNIVSLLTSKTGIDLYNEITPALYALLVPKIRLMVEYHKPGKKVKVRDLRFQEYLGKDQLVDLMKGVEGRIPGVGLIFLKGCLKVPKVI